MEFQVKIIITKIIIKIIYFSFSNFRLLLIEVVCLLLFVKLFREEWDSLCTLVQKDEELEAISKLEVWKARVPSLPLGAEVTLLTLKAKVSERQDHSASLYSLALIRYLSDTSRLVKVVSLD